MRAPFIFLTAVSAATPAAAQLAADQSPPAQASEADGFGEEIVVNGARERGAVVGDIKPEVVLRGGDIRAYGASNLGELLDAIAPLTGSNQGAGGQPVTLLDGRRISNFREIRDLPPEAVVRIDILPEEVALKYGYRPDQKVVNFVLRERFRATTVEADVRLATDGGRRTDHLQGNYLKLQRGTRLSLDGEYTHATPLFETERDLAFPNPDRTLLSSNDALKLNGAYNQMILGNVSATIDGEFNAQDSRAALGVSTVGNERLIRDGRTRTGSIGYALNGRADGWQWSVDGGYTRDLTTNLTDRQAGRAGGRDYTRAVNQSLNTTGTATGTLFELPAGSVTTTIKAGFDTADIVGVSRRTASFSSTNLSRDSTSGQLNIDVPVSRSGTIGSLSFNGNAAVERLSDFGTLRTYGVGVHWTPVSEVRVIASYTNEEDAPTIRDLGSPVLVTPNVQLLDLTTGTTVNLTRVSGGNPTLLGSERRVRKLGVTLKPFDSTDLTFLGTYTHTSIDNAVGALPVASPEIEAAFRDRFSRDGNGVLTRIDSRPVNSARTKSTAFRWGFNWSKTLKAPPPTGADGKPLTTEEIAARREAMRAQFQGRGNGPPDGNRGAGTGRRSPGGGSFGGPGGNQGRLQFSLFHNWRITDTVLIRPGLPVLDLLDGSAIGASGGVARHEITADAGYNRNGIGARASLNWESATQVRQTPGGPPSPNDLRFGSQATIDLRLFADLGVRRELVRKSPFFRGSRVTVGIDNLFNRRTDVRDASGNVPLGYQRDLLDPLGRTVRISFRKLFFPAFTPRGR